MKDERNRILRNSNQTGENQDGREEDEKSVGLANLKESQEYIEVFRTSQLLLVVH